MGTSSSYSAPTKGPWPAVKRVVTYFAKQSGTGTITPAQVTRTYVNALGGKKSAAASATAGRTAVQRLGSFLTGILSVGLTQTLEDAGLSFLIGKDAITVISGLVDYLVGPGSTIEESVAREAMVGVLESMFGNADENQIEEVFSRSIDENGLDGLLERFTVEYIFTRMLQKIQKQIESGAINTKQAVALERMIRNYIKEQVSFKITSVDLHKLNFMGKEGSDLIVSLFEDAYGVLLSEMEA